MRIGIIGLGNAGQRHVKNLQALGYKDLMGFDAVTKRQEHIHFACTLDAFYNWKPEAVIIATPPEAHYTHAIDAIHQGVPVFVEKPLATTLDEGRYMVGEAYVCGVRLSCGYQLRAHQSVRALLMKIIESKTSIWYSSILQDQMEQWPTASYERTVLWEFSHELDLAAFLMGPFIKVYAEQWTNGYHVQFDARYGSGEVVLHNGGEGPLRFVETDVGSWHFSADENEQAYKDELTVFLEGHPSDNGLSTMRLIDAVQRSLHGEGWVSINA